MDWGSEEADGRQRLEVELSICKVKTWRCQDRAGAPSRGCE